jgi:hypothetical protein
VSKSDKKMQEIGLLLRLVESGSNTAVKVSLGRRLEENHPNHLDIYIISWALFQLLIIIALVFTSFGDAVKTIIFILLGYQLLEIAITNFDSVFVRVMQGKGHKSVPRLFSLIFVNYIEIILSFGIIFRLLINNATVAQSLNYSVSLATLSGLTFDNPTTALYIAGIIEMLLGVFFVTGAIAAIANYIGEKE